MLDFLAFPDDSKMWVYPSNVMIDDDLIPKIHYTVQDFTDSWVSHNKQLKATGGILHNFFVVLVVDESQAGTSGCSLDKSVHFLQQLGSHLNVNFFDRFVFHYIDKEKVKAIHKSELKQALENGIISMQTRFFDPLVNNKKQFLKSWVVPLEDSWIKKMI